MDKSMVVTMPDGSPVKVPEVQSKGVHLARTLASNEIVVANSVIHDRYGNRYSKAKVAQAKALKEFAERILEVLP